MSKSSKYWEQRFAQLEAASHSYGVATYSEIEPAFDYAQREIQEKIEVWYGRVAKNNEISIQEARKMLSASELKEFHWDVKEYIRHGRENAVNGIWIKELENASAKFHISRLEALKVRTQQAIEVAFGNEGDTIDDMARKIYSDTYYHSIFEMQKGINLGFEIGQIDERKLQKIISKPWAADGKNFSDRIWQSKSQLVNEIHTELTRNCILGKAPDEAIKHISEKFNVSKSQAGRLVMTEEAYFHSAAQKDAFNELGIKEYEILATLDSHTSEICRSLDGKVFPMEEYSPGSTAPPFHPWCRTVTIPHFDDNYGGERAARDENGNTYYVPDNLTYKDWEKKYIKDAVSQKDIKSFNSIKATIGDEFLKTIEDYIKIKYNNNYDTYKKFKAYVSSVKNGELTPLADFDLYVKISQEIDKTIVGLQTSNGITITGKSNHCIARVIGSVEQRRNGVQVSDMLNALTKDKSEVLPIRISKNGKSQKFRNNVVEVTVNPDTGNIIQVNPVSKKRKKVE